MLQKVSPHVIRPTPAALRWAQRSHVVKSMDNLAPLEVAPAHAIRIFRHFFRNQDVYAHSAMVAGELLHALGGYRHPLLYVEVFNEIPKELTAQHADLLDEVVPILHQSGVKVIGPCWSTGDFEQEHWEEMRRHGWCGLDGVALHAYWGMPHGLPQHEVLTPWNALRYREHWRPGDPPLFITECGRDMVRDAPGGKYVGGKGWRNDGLSAEEFIDELEAYEAELQKDPYVLGATVFSAGPSDDWRAFDTDEISDRFVINPEPYRLTETPPPAPEVTPVPAPSPRVSQLGRGLWVWYLDVVGGPEGIVDKAHRAGAQWVAIKGGDGPSRWSQLTADLVSRIKALDPSLGVWGWTYGYGGQVPGSAHTGWWTVEDEITVAKSVVSTTGIDGYICDVEAEWANRPDPAHTGKVFADAIRVACDEAEIPFAYAPVPIISNHPTLPYVQFNAVCDYVMPQLYAGNMQHITFPVWTLERMIDHWYTWRKQWEDAGLRVPTIAPAFDAYDRTSVDDIRKFEESAVQNPEWPGWSYWSMQHASGEMFDAMAASPGERVIITDPPPFDPSPAFDIDVERAILWTVKDRLRANGWPRFAQAIEAATTQSKGEQ